MNNPTDPISKLIEAGRQSVFSGSTTDIVEEKSLGPITPVYPSTASSNPVASPATPISSEEAALQAARQKISELSATYSKSPRPKLNEALGAAGDIVSNINQLPQDR